MKVMCVYAAAVFMLSGCASEHDAATGGHGEFGEAIPSPTYSGPVTAEDFQKELDQEAQSEKAEADAEQQTGKVYYACLVKHAHTLALVSTETADVVAEAALPSCQPERAAFYAVAAKYEGATFASALIDKIDAKFQPMLVLEVVKARAARVVQKSAKQPPQQEKPI